MSTQDALDLWNVSAARAGWPLVRRMTPDRERKLRALTKHGLDDWREALAKAEASDFLCGRTERRGEHQGWRFNFDTMVRESFFVKILEGNYDNREAGIVLPSKDPDTLQQEARVRGFRQTGFWMQSWGEKPGEVH